MASHHKRINFVEEMEIRGRTVKGNNEPRKENMLRFKDLYTETPRGDLFLTTWPLTHWMIKTKIS